MEFNKNCKNCGDTARRCVRTNGSESICQRCLQNGVTCWNVPTIREHTHGMPCSSCVQQRQPCLRYQGPTSTCSGCAASPDKCRPYYALARGSHSHPPSPLSLNLNFAGMYQNSMGVNVSAGENDSVGIPEKWCGQCELLESQCVCRRRRR